MTDMATTILLPPFGTQREHLADFCFGLGASNECTAGPKNEIRLAQFRKTQCRVQCETSKLGASAEGPILRDRLIPLRLGGKPGILTVILHFEVT